MRRFFILFSCLVILWGCEKNQDGPEPVISDYTGSYKNVDYSETLIGNFPVGIYSGTDIPDALRDMTFGRIEIDFNYMGGALTSFMPLLYYGSVNKNHDDDALEETQFHLVAEIGHYNVIPFAVENLFYTICYDRYPLYCRDTYVPVISGEDYTFIIDKRPEGIILQLRRGNEIVNSLPSAFFPDSAGLFFRDVTRRIDQDKGDSLEAQLMVGQGFVGFEEGLHTFHGQVPGIRIYRYDLTGNSGYELFGTKNQHFAGEQISYSVRDNLSGEGNNLWVRYDFQPYHFENGRMLPSGTKISSEKKIISINELTDYTFTPEDIGLYEFFCETTGSDNQVINSTRRPFSIWVYPRSWAFDY